MDNIPQEASPQEEKSMDNIPQNAVQYDNVARYRLLQFLALVAVIFLIILFFLLIKDIYSKYRQIDNPYQILLIISSFMSFSITIYFIYERLMKIKSAISCRKLLIIIFLSLTLLLAVITFICYHIDPFPTYIDKSDIIVAQFEEMVELPMTLSIEGLSFPNATLKVGDYIRSSLEHQIIDLSLDEIIVASSNRIVTKYTQAKNWLKKNSNTDVIIWGTSAISLGQFNRICPIISLKKKWLMNYKEKPIACVKSTYETVIDISANSNDLSELDVWLFLVVVNVFLESESFAKNITAQSLISDRAIQYSNDLDNKYKNIESQVLKDHYQNIKSILKAIICKLKTDVHNPELKNKLSTEYGNIVNIKVNSYDLNWNEAVTIMNEAAYYDKINNVELSYNLLKNAINKLDICLNFKPCDFNSIYYKAICLHNNPDTRSEKESFINTILNQCEILEEGQIESLHSLMKD